MVDSFIVFRWFFFIVVGIYASNYSSWKKFNEVSLKVVLKYLIVNTAQYIRSVCFIIHATAKFASISFAG